MRRLFETKFAARAILASLLAAFVHAPVFAEVPDTAVKSTEPRVVADSPVDAGRYIIRIAGCHDCHTPEWMETGGNVAEDDYLVGVPIGWRGPWGTTYASNLRRVANELSEDGFVALLKARVERPPMPWMNVNKLSDTDARAIYQYIRSLGMRGEKMPAAVGPGVEPSTPYYSLEPMGIDRVAETRTDQAGDKKP